MRQCPDLKEQGIANNNKADFFLSIHVNSSLTPRGVGHENYVSSRRVKRLGLQGTSNSIKEGCSS